MRSLFLIFCLMLVTSNVVAHEMTPTYPKLSPAYVQGVVKTSVEMLNRREDVAYFEMNVYDKDWYDIPFVSASQIVHLEYLKRASVDLYINVEDADRAVYICSTSMLKGDKRNQSIMASKICSKIKHD